MDRGRRDGSDTASVLARGEYDWSRTSPSSVVVDAIAAVENVKPTNLAADRETTLYDHVDPGALDRLVSDRDEPITVTFTLWNYHVRFDDEEFTVSHAVDR